MDTISKVIILNGHNPKWTQSQMDTIQMSAYIYFFQVLYTYAR